MKKVLPLFLLLSACAAPRPQTVPPPRFGFGAVADSIVHASDLNQTLWGIEVFDPARNRVLYTHNGTRHFIPASNTKLVVTTAAMGILGPEWRYQTMFLTSGAAGDSVTDRIIAVGSGDPTWSSRYNRSGGGFAVLDAIADSIARTGIRRIRDELVVDASFFGRERVHGTWEIGDLPFSSAAPVAAFAINEALMQVEIVPGSGRGTPGTARVLGPADAINLRAAITTDSARASTTTNVDFHEWPNVVMTGRIRADQPDTTTLAMPDAARFTAAAFRDALTRRGISVPSVRVVYDTLEAAQLRSSAPRILTKYTSPPLSDIVAGILQPSQNWIAEQLVKTLGGLKAGRGTWAAGVTVETRFLAGAGVDSTAMFIRDASGLSAQNLLTPRAIIAMLNYSRQQPWGTLYRQGMPTPQLRGSTLSSRLAGLENKVFAKTGTITNVNSLSGYITTANGRELIFSIMSNGSGRPSAQVRRAIDRLVVSLSEQREWDER